MASFVDLGRLVKRPLSNANNVQFVGDQQSIALDLGATGIAHALLRLPGVESGEMRMIGTGDSGTEWVCWVMDVERVSRIAVGVIGVASVTGGASPEQDAVGLLGSYKLLEGGKPGSRDKRKSVVRGRTLMPGDRVALTHCDGTLKAVIITGAAPQSPMAVPLPKAVSKDGVLPYVGLFPGSQVTLRGTYRVGQEIARLTADRYRDTPLSELDSVFHALEHATSDADRGLLAFVRTSLSAFVRVRAASSQIGQFGSSSGKVLRIVSQGILSECVEDVSKEVDALYSQAETQGSSQFHRLSLSLSLPRNRGAIPGLSSPATNANALNEGQRERERTAARLEVERESAELATSAADLFTAYTTKRDAHVTECLRRIAEMETEAEEDPGLQALSYARGAEMSRMGLGSPSLSMLRHRHIPDTRHSHYPWGHRAQESEPDDLDGLDSDDDLDGPPHPDACPIRVRYATTHISELMFANSELPPMDYAALIEMFNTLTADVCAAAEAVGTLWERGSALIQSGRERERLIQQVTAPLSALASGIYALFVSEDMAPEPPTLGMSRLVRGMRRSLARLVEAGLPVTVLGRSGINASLLSATCAFTNGLGAEAVRLLRNAWGLYVPGTNIPNEYMLGGVGATLEESYDDLDVAGENEAGSVRMDASQLLRRDLLALCGLRDASTHGDIFSVFSADTIGQTLAAREASTGDLGLGSRLLPAVVLAVGGSLRDVSFDASAHAAEGAAQEDLSHWEEYRQRLFFGLFKVFVDALRYAAGRTVALSRGLDPFPCPEGLEGDVSDEDMHRYLPLMPEQAVIQADCAGPSREQGLGESGWTAKDMPVGPSTPSDSEATPLIESLVHIVADLEATRTLLLPVLAARLGDHFGLPMSQGIANTTLTEAARMAPHPALLRASPSPSPAQGRKGARSGSGRESKTKKVVAPVESRATAAQRRLMGEVPRLSLGSSEDKGGRGGVRPGVSMSPLRLSLPTAALSPNARGSPTSGLSMSARSAPSSSPTGQGLNRSLRGTSGPGQYQRPKPFRPLQNVMPLAVTCQEAGTTRKIVAAALDETLRALVGVVTQGIVGEVEQRILRMKHVYTGFSNDTDVNATLRLSIQRGCPTERDRGTLGSPLPNSDPTSDTVGSSTHLVSVATPVLVVRVLLYMMQALRVGQGLPARVRAPFLRLVGLRIMQALSDNAKTHIRHVSQYGAMRLLLLQTAIFQALRPVLGGQAEPPDLSVGVMVHDVQQETAGSGGEGSEAEEGVPASGGTEVVYRLIPIGDLDLDHELMQIVVETQLESVSSYTQCLAEYVPGCK
ncbi:hypothetical protein KIPB_000419 [Kipferlia bialata]|uniref:Uncharacterized protein n=1 Tax=Kipferlia bialata TaxID=797122 RepID=A0A9K3CQG7_9EUKA|nr:hypothetical protein KIPB_000419 [Kipferlia bialata]|eukprot:g419.t1